MARKPLPISERRLGAPRKYDLKQEAKDLMAWANRDTSLRLYGFTDDKDYCAAELKDFANCDNDFALALCKAKEKLALRREEHANDDMIKSHVYTKTAHVYDKEMVEADESLKDKEMLRKMKLLEHEINLKSQAGIVYDETMLATQKALLDQLSFAQRSLNKATSKSKSEP